MTYPSKLFTPKDLRGYQWRAFKFAWKRFACALFLDMGLGKTIIVLSWIKALFHKGRITKPVLLVAPIRVMYGVWAQEADQWTHTRSLRFSIVHGSIEQRKNALDISADIYMINPENLVWLLRLFNNHKAKEDWPFDVLVIDESSMFKAAGSKRFNAISWRIGLFKYRLIMSGTPTPNSLREIWPQMFIIDEGKRLGETFKNFDNRFFYTPKKKVEGEKNARKKHQVAKPVPYGQTQKRIYGLIKDVALSMELTDPDIKQDFKERGKTIYKTVINDVYVDLPPAARAIYNEFEKEMFIELDKGDVEAFNPAVLCGKCHQIANGAIYSIDRETENRIWEHVHDAKLDALEEILNETSTPVLIPYWFKHDMIRIKRRWPDTPHFNNKNLSTLEKEWNANKHRRVGAHYSSVSHGSNLQHGEARTYACFSLTYSYEKYTQILNRFGGARARFPIMCHRIVARDTVDEVMVRVQNTKAQGHKSFMAALKAYKKQRVGA